MSHPTKFEGVTADTLANVYFDGKVISHTLHFADKTRKTLGIILPGSYSFNTGAPERMDITAGVCRVRLAGEDEWAVYAAGAGFNVPGNSSFEIAVEEGQAQYICSFE